MRCDTSEPNTSTSPLTLGVRNTLSSAWTKYVNQLFTLEREVRDPATQAITVAANYQSLTPLLLTVIALGVLMPVLAIVVVKRLGWRSA